MYLRVLLLAALAAGASAQSGPYPCSSCAAWNRPYPPFRIFANVYYVGTDFLSSVLITSPTGHVLIDGGLPESAPHIAASVRALGFRLEDVKLIVNSHSHIDHAGGLAELQKLTGAPVSASAWGSAVLEKGAVPRDDPQYGSINPVPPVARVRVAKDGETLRAGGIAITAHLTPGHTPGGMSWTWRSCEDEVCRDMVYADSLTAISTDGFLYSRRPQYANGTADFQQSFRFLESTGCDVLITPHPDFEALRQDFRKAPASGGGACRALAASARQKLEKRLASERAQ